MNKEPKKDTILQVSQKELDTLKAEIVRDDNSYDPDDYEEVTEIHAGE
jgi:hypothetical protein